MNDFKPVNKDKSYKTNNNFTNGQKLAIDGIIDFIDSPYNDVNFTVGLTGAGGTGKTFVTNYIISNCKYGLSSIKLSSTSHKSCRVLSEHLNNKQVDTIQKVLGLRLDLRLENFDPRNPQFNPLSKVKLDNIKLLIIDESSLLPIKLVSFICNKCKELNIKILFIGDPYQLAPINEKNVTVFSRCFKIFNLTEIVRQSSDNPITNLLPIIRSDIDGGKTRSLELLISKNNFMKYNDVGEGLSILKYNDFINHIDKCFDTEEFYKNIDMFRIISYTNKNVSSWNKYVRNTIIKDSHNNIINKNDLIMSYQTIVNEFFEIVINNSEDYIIHDIVEFVESKYNMKGYLVRFQLIHGGSITKPIFILNHTDIYSIRIYHKIIEELEMSAKAAKGSARSNAWKQYYEFKKSYLIISNILDKSGKILHYRDLDYGYSITANKAQGSTYDSVFVDLYDIIYNKNGMMYPNKNEMLRRLYVACSRPKKELIICHGR